MIRRRSSQTATAVLAVILFAALELVAVWASGCAPTPTPLTPDATAAFYSTRVVKVLDVLRDAAIAGNELVPQKLTTDSTRQVVIWHKTAVKAIEGVPNGWQSAVKASLYALTCDPRAGSGTCTSPLKPAEVQWLTPYVGLAVVILAEVQ